MGREDTYKKIEKLSKELFFRTGKINYYGMSVAAREQMQSKNSRVTEIRQNEEEQEFGMY